MRKLIYFLFGFLIVIAAVRFVHAASPMDVLIDHQPYCANTVQGLPGPTVTMTGVVSGVCTFPPPPPPTGCMAPTGYTRLTRTSVSYGATGSSMVSRDLTTWDGLYGFGNTGQALPAPWAGVVGAAPVVRNLGKKQFIAAAFDTGNAPLTRAGFLIYNSNIGGPNIEAKISTSCGDFVPVTSACYKASAYSDDSRFLSWRMGSGTNRALCYLAPNTRYYLNVRYVTNNNRICASSSCPFFTTSQWSP